ncbi:hypothetical protein CCHR01_15438 [Colletotrichum chrysophilum]|uniref:Uncharacterized protein n=1 Tax=Colletotrichum chrysophilum TaxID=1836956 RepID=A0AAD9EBE6_9PEZI|nr:hypothetical protein CCHR01_15438 [Colletotrichum chrysophilum]
MITDYNPQVRIRSPSPLQVAGERRNPKDAYARTPSSCPSSNDRRPTTNLAPSPRPVSLTLASQRELGKPISRVSHQSRTLYDGKVQRRTQTDAAAWLQWDGASWMLFSAAPRHIPLEPYLDYYFHSPIGYIALNKPVETIWNSFVAAVRKCYVSAPPSPLAHLHNVEPSPRLRGQLRTTKESLFPRPNASV